MLVVHHLGMSQSDRIVWLCEELGLDYELRLYSRHPETGAAPPEYAALHPFGKSPVITDGDFVLAESGAIIEYLINRYGGGRLIVGPGATNYADYLFWFHFANGSLMPALMLDLIPSGPAGDPYGLFRANFQQRVDRAYAFLDARLSGHPYLAGSDLTAADIMSVFPLTTMRKFVPRDLSPYPGVRGYLKRIGARPAFQRMMKKADPGIEALLG